VSGGLKALFLHLSPALLGILSGTLLCHLIMADFTLNIAALLWELHWTFKATHIVAFFAFFSAVAFAELKCALLKRFLRVQIISILFLDTLQGSSTHRSSSSHGYDHNAFWSKNRPPHPDPWNQRPRRPWCPHPQTDVCWYIWTKCSFIWAWQLVPFPLCLSITFRLPWPSFQAPFATSDDCWSLTFLQQTKLLPMKPYLFFAFLAGRKSDPFIFPKIFTNWLAHPCHKYSPQNLPSSVVLPKHWTLQEFWHSY